MRNAAALLLCCLSLPAVAAAPVPGANPASGAEQAATIAAIAQEWLRATGAPSASVAVVLHGDLVYAQGFGRARLDPAHAADAGTRYSVDSVSKEFTAAALLLLAEDGSLSLDDPVGRWLPELKAPAAVTLRQALTHTAGLRDYWPQDFVTPEMSHPASPAAIAAEWADRPLDFEPGSDWQYSNTGYLLAGLVVERASGRPLLEFLQSRIFSPLGMQRVADYDAGPLPAADAGPYTRYGKGPVRAAPKEGSGWLFGAAELAMSPSELARWDLSLLDHRLLRPESYAAEFMTTVLKDGRDTHYALGLEVGEHQGRRRIGHNGAGSGFLAANRLYPDERAAIVVLTNNDWASPDDLVDRLAFALLPPATPAHGRARAVFEGLRQGTIDRRWFTPVGNFYLTPAVLSDLRKGFEHTGPARQIRLQHESRRGGMITRRWLIVCDGEQFDATERAPPDGPLEEFFVAPHGD
jgi:CubicO group peptidase (beta-lactamase class C family)